MILHFIGDLTKQKEVGNIFVAMLVVQSVNRFARSLLSERRTSANPAKFRYRFSRSTVPGAVKRIEMEPVLNNILFLADSYKVSLHFRSTTC